jgi:hypothetical protein
MDESILVQQAIKEVSEGKVSEEQVYRFIGMGLSQREGEGIIRGEDIDFRLFDSGFPMQGEERGFNLWGGEDRSWGGEDRSLWKRLQEVLWEEEGRSFWEKYKCEALKIFCKAIQENSRLEQALHDVFVYFLGKFGPSVVMGLIYLILLKGAQAMCELLSKDCEEKKGDIGQF